MEGKTISIRISKSLYNRILDHLGGRGSLSDFIKKSIELNLSGGVSRAVEDGSVRVNSRPDAGRSVISSVSEFIMKNPDWLDKIPEDKQAQIVSSIGIKLAQNSSDSENAALSLRESLRSLSSIEDVSKELSKAKGEAHRLGLELSTYKELLSSRGNGDLRVLYERILKNVLEVLWDWLIRNDLPGIGSGGGLSQRGMERVSEESLRWIKKEMSLS